MTVQEMIQYLTAIPEQFRDENVMVGDNADSALDISYVCRGEHIDGINIILIVPAP